MTEDLIISFTLVGEPECIHGFFFNYYFTQSSEMLEPVLWSSMDSHPAHPKTLQTRNTQTVTIATEH